MITAFFFFINVMMETVLLSGIGEIKVRRGVNIKYLRIRMAPGRGIWVSVPPRVSRTQVERFLEANRDWVLQNQKQLEIYERDTGVGLRIGAEIKTKFHLLKIVGTDELKPTYRKEGEIILLFIPKQIEFKRIEKLVQQFLLEIYTFESRSYLPERVKCLAANSGFSYKKITLRNNTSIWGSCSADDHISLNIKLMKLPDAIIDYVILHELCHTIEKNHSLNFWKLMESVCPDYVVLRKQLRKYNTRL